MKYPTNAYEMLARAADLIEEKGHTQGHLQDAEGRLCFYGALRIVAHGSTSDMSRFDAGPISNAYHDAIYAMAKRVGCEPWVWNDDITKDAEEVIKTMREVASELKAEADPVKGVAT